MRKNDDDNDNSIYAGRCTISDIQDDFNSILLGGSGDSLEESEANYFAMCLLMPKNDLLKLINEIGGFEEVKKGVNISALARIFNVPDELMLIRIKEIEDEIIEEERNKRNTTTKSRAEELECTFIKSSLNAERGEHNE